MKTVSGLPILIVLVLFAALTSAVRAAAPPETLKLADLVNHPDRWPASVTLNCDFKFTDGSSAKKGQSVRIIQFNGSEVVVDGGNNVSFGIAPGDCDLLEAANKAWAALTPAQRAIDVTTIRKDSSLWPDKVKCSCAFTLNSGKDLPAGQEYQFLTLDDQGAVLWGAQDKVKLNADIAQTDMIARARERALINPAKRSSRIADALRGNLVNVDGKPDASANLDDVQVFALYYGASWCGPCRAFSPGFVKYINSVSAQNPRLMVVLMSNDKNDADMLKYMTDEKMPWPAVSLATINKTPVLLAYPRGYIPHLVIVDRYGKILADSYRGDTYVGPKVAMQGLAQVLKAGVAK